MEAIIKIDAFGKKHKVYRISDFDHTAFQKDLSTVFLMHAYVDTEFKYLVIEKVRYDGGKRCAYRTVPIYNMVDRSIHGFYTSMYTSMVWGRDELMDFLMEEFLASRLGISISYLRKNASYKKQRSILEMSSVCHNATSAELLAMAERL